MQEKQTFYVKRGERTIGPVSTVRLLDAARAGKVRASDLIRSNGSEGWLAVSRIGWLATPIERISALQGAGRPPSQSKHVVAPPSLPNQGSRGCRTSAAATSPGELAASSKSQPPVIPVPRQMRAGVADSVARFLRREGPRTIQAVRAQIRRTMSWGRAVVRPKSDDQREAVRAAFRRLLPDNGQDRIRVGAAAAVGVLLIVGIVGCMNSKPKTPDLESPFGISNIVQLQEYYAKQQREQEEQLRQEEAAEQRELERQRAEHDGAIAAGERHRRSGQLQQAMREYLRAANLDEDRPESHYGLGLTAMQLEQWNDAVQRFNEATSADYEFGPAFVARGKCYLELADFDDAIDDLSRAISIDPSRAETYVLRAIAHRRSENHEEAARDATVAIRLDGSGAAAHFERGVARLSGEGKDLRGAIEDLGNVISRDPQMARAYYLRGQALCQLNQYENALTDFNRAYQLEPQKTETLHASLNVALKTENHPLIIEMVSRLFERGECAQRDARQTALRHRVTSYLAVGDLQHAEQDLTRLIELRPRDVDYYQQRQQVRLALGNATAAETDASSIAELQQAAEAAQERSIARSRENLRRLTQPSSGGYSSYGSNNYAAQAQAAAEEAAAREMRRYRSQMSGRMGALGVQIP